jgi:hypothetical protein
VRRLAVILLIVAALACAAYGYYRYSYPYGMSHCCDKALYFELSRYAAEHDGWFPRGEASPEASLSLLYRQDPANAYNLRGKTVPESVVSDRLSRGELLTPETCGWHYVEGLRADDDPRLALFWDKAGLDHVGGRLLGGGHTVILVDGEAKGVPESDWPAFIEEQRRLLAERTEGNEVRVDARFEFLGKPIQVQLRVVSGSLYGRWWQQGYACSGELLATVRGEPPARGDVPVVTTAEIRNARVVVEQEKGRVRFVLHAGQVVFDGTKFAFQAGQQEP